MVASDLSSIGEIGPRMGLAGPVESPATASHHFAAMRKPCRQPKVTGAPQGHELFARVPIRLDPCQFAHRAATH